MIEKLPLGGALMATCVVIHASGMATALRWLQQRPPTAQRFWPMTGFLIRLAAWIICLHLVQICAWALLYVWQEAMPDFQAAAYFSAVTYTTTGYGDLMLPPEWRLVGGVEALTGILMCGLSTGFFFAVVSRSIQSGRAEMEVTRR